MYTLFIKKDGGFETTGHDRDADQLEAFVNDCFPGKDYEIRDADNNIIKEGTVPTGNHQHTDLERNLISVLRVIAKAAGCSTTSLSQIEDFANRALEEVEKFRIQQ